MANKNFVVQYAIKMRNQYSAQADKIAKSTVGLDRKLRRNSKTYLSLRVSIAKAAKSLRKFGKENFTLTSGMKALAVQALSAISVFKTFDEGGKFEDAMADLQAITGATGKDLEFLKEQTIAMGKASKTSLTDVAEGLKLVASAKPELLKNIPALTAMTKEVLLLKNASGIELSEAALVTARSLNIFGKEANEAGRFVDILAAGSKFGSSEIADTGRAVLISGGAAKAAGLSFVQLNAAIQATAKAGFAGEKAGTALQAIISRLRVQGLDIGKLGIPKTFEKIKTALEKIKDPTKRAMAEAKLFGLEHQKVGLALLGQIETMKLLERQLVTQGVAQEQAAIRTSTFNSELKKLGVVVTSKLVRAFDSLAPSIQPGIESVTGLLDALDPRGIEIFLTPLKILLLLINGIIQAIIIAITLIKGFVQTIAQLIAAIATMDFSNFDLEENFSLGGKILGIGDLRGQVADIVSGVTGAEAAIRVRGAGNLPAINNAQAPGRVDVGVQVGLDRGLTQTNRASVSGSGVGRSDVGLATAGL